EFGDVNETVLRSEEVHEGTEVHHLDDLAVVDLTDLGFRHDRLDPFDRGLDRIAVCGRDLHRAVILDVDFGLGLLDDLPAHLSPGSDYFADLVCWNLHRLDARRMLAELCACMADGMRHLPQYVHAPVTRLLERDAHNLLGDSGDLDVHLQRRDALIGARHLEV